MSTTTTHLMTAEELFVLDDDSHRHELIKGELLTMPLASCLHGAVTANLIVILYNHVEPNNLGALVARSGFKLETNPDTVLGPDIAFIKNDRVGPISDSYFSSAPDLAIEVLDLTDQVERKTALWLDLGATSVWNVDPRKRSVEVVHADAQRWLFHETDELVDDTVPGFRVAVSKIFE